jgi:hypothetical protein
MNNVVMYFSLDLVSFTTAQPTAGTCTDTFQVGGSTSTVPIICGDNSGQHSEYIEYVKHKIRPFGCKSF